MNEPRRLPERELALEQRVDQRRAIAKRESLLPDWTQLVEGARDELLARARRARDQHVRIMSRDLFWPAQALPASPGFFRRFRGTADSETVSARVRESRIAAKRVERARRASSPAADKSIGLHR